MICLNRWIFKFKISKEEWKCIAKNCGKEIDNKAEICIECGVQPSVNTLSNGVKYMKLGNEYMGRVSEQMNPITSKSTQIQTQIATPEPLCPRYG